MEELGSTLAKVHATPENLPQFVLPQYSGCLEETDPITLLPHACHTSLTFFMPRFVLFGCLDTLSSQ